MARHGRARGMEMAKRKKSVQATGVGAAAAAQERLLGTVHQVWLAGLGAVSRAQKGAPKLLEDLVEEGARVHARGQRLAGDAMRSVMEEAQTALKGRVSGVRERASDAYDNLEKMFQSRVQRALKQLGVPSAAEISGLSSRVDALNANIEKLSRQRPAGRTPGRPAGRKTRGDGRRRGAASHPAA